MVDDPQGVPSDDIQDTLDYRSVCAIVEQEMSQPSDLLEHVAGRIVRAIADKFPEFVKFSVRVSKQMPPVGGSVQWSRVTLTFNNE